jgi:hypothetical protein
MIFQEVDANNHKNPGIFPGFFVEMLIILYAIVWYATACIVETKKNQPKQMH